MLLIFKVITERYMLIAVTLLYFMLSSILYFSNHIFTCTFPSFLPGLTPLYSSHIASSILCRVGLVDTTSVACLNHGKIFFLL